MSASPVGSVGQGEAVETDETLDVIEQAIRGCYGPGWLADGPENTSSMRCARAVMAALADRPVVSSPRVQGEPDHVAALPVHLAYISRTVTASYPDGMDDELVFRRRVGKVGVEFGELQDAIEGWTGENPRKGQYASRDDVVKELIDCASASLCAVEHMTGDAGSALEMLARQVAGNAQRLSASIPDICGGGESVD